MVFRLNANSFSAVFYVAIFIYNTHFQFIPTVNFSIECRLILKLILCVCVCVCVCVYMCVSPSVVCCITSHFVLFQVSVQSSPPGHNACLVRQGSPVLEVKI